MGSYCTDDKGFLAISGTLQCSGGPDNVFACGDVASSAENPRPKAGVFAVRQGPPLTSNLRRCQTLSHPSLAKGSSDSYGVQSKYCIGEGIPRSDTMCQS